MSLNIKQKEIYSRQIEMDEIGEEGQQKLLKASALVVGCGGLGAPVLYYLTAMGIGHLGICDGDNISLPNLNRQILFEMDDTGKQKVKVTRKRLTALNPDLKITIYDEYMDDKLAKKVIPDYDIVIDCLDNFDTRFILNDACIKFKKPLIHAGIEEYYGQMMTIIPGEGPCLRCLFPNGIDENKKKKQPGVIGPTPGVLGAMQAMEAAKYILGLKVCNDGLIMYDGLNQSTEKVLLKTSPKCKCKS